MKNKYIYAFVVNILLSLRTCLRLTFSKNFQLRNNCANLEAELCKYHKLKDNEINERISYHIVFLKHILQVQNLKQKSLM